MIRHWPTRRALVTDLILAAVAGAFDLAIFLSRTEDVGFRPGGALPSSVGIALVLVGPAAVVFRRRWPVTTFLIAWAAAMTAIVFPELQPFGALLVALFTVASITERQRAVLVLVATAGVFAVQVVNTAPDNHRVVGVGITILFDSVLVGLVWAAARFRYRTTRRLSELRRRREEEVRSARRQERLSVSRDLHDIVSHSVSAMTLQAAGAKAVMEQQPERVSPALEAIERSGVQAMNELQRLLEVLRSDDDYAESASAADRLSRLPDLIGQARADGQQVELIVTGDPCELDPSVEITCYRVVQEALNNAAKHAGADATVQVRLQWLPPRLSTSVVNNSGRPGGTDRPSELSTGHGLVGLAERVELVGGEFETTSLPDGGFAITATLPVYPPPSS